MKRDHDTCRKCDAKLRGKRAQATGVCPTCAREEVTK